MNLKAFFKVMLLVAALHTSTFLTTGHAETNVPFSPANYALNSSSFELIRGIIVVQAEIEGEYENFILDTGSPMMILNENPNASKSFQANTLQGEIAGEWKEIDQFAWAGVRKFDMKALKMDIRHLESVTERPIKGLIGYDFFGDFDLLLDFESQVVTLAPQGFAAKLDDWHLRSEIPFVLEGHLPVIEAEIGGAKFRFGLDTGAGANLCDLTRKKEIAPELLAPLQNAEVVGVGAGFKDIVAADVLETQINGVNYWNMRYIFSDISHLHNLKNNKVDGLLGYPFFKSGKFTINYGKKLISFWN